jgi:sugar O-acyltransferase (sialic acid O-acetyltransferase NeuD family)
MTNVLVIGAGGHGLVVADILLRAHDAGVELRPVGFLDDDKALVGSTVLGLPVLGAGAQSREHDHDAVIVAIGDNMVRKRAYEEATSRGERLATAVHPRAVVAPDVRLGDGVMVCAGVVVNPGTIIGENVILNTGCSVDHHNNIGAHAHIAPGVRLGGAVSVGEGALVGIGAVVAPGLSLGEGCTVGAGAVVLRNVPPGITVVGNPARELHRD